MSPAALAKKLKAPGTTMQNILLRLERKGFATVNESNKTLTYNALHLPGKYMKVANILPNPIKDISGFRKVYIPLLLK